MEKLFERVNHILEALPYITKYSGKTVVIKYGGAAMAKADLKESFAKDIVLLKYVGIHPVIVHGGGPEINRLLESLKIPTEFVHGHRVTDSQTMDVVEMVLTGKVNKQIVSMINAQGGNAVGISGKDGNLAKATKTPIEIELEGQEKQLFDVGLVGKIETINPEILLNLQKEGFIPVISPVAESATGDSLNINADTFAGEVAGALKAEKLILLTDTEGILIDGKLATGLNRGKVKDYIRKGEISGGMIPKVECCLTAIDQGVRRTHIIDGRVPHSILIEIFTNQGIGSLIE
ncbi:acetylglutamate kinase [Leptospira stimsonii]|uniref:Acetylglutamate kinase n=1 Tax=Leptospira stimsonii TaxID=2202203 RepID=A0A4R9L5B1_9LEPT|nr:acetylglutamate kinase [Leptospira stimsonii]RHX83503.1 acetylglutamate kinase [Leptospira stimsonii]TGK20434.1 acetylglutamate kinase [Leptospira stimsonii]TGM14224.1 acetylglutamate kinase [Leptospira stimsonii]